MKIGVSTLAMYPAELKNILRHLEELGVEYCEIINEYPYHQVEDLDSYQVKTTVHAPLSDINLASHNRAIREASIREMKSSMDLAVKVDSPVVVVHPGQMPILRRDLEKKVLNYNLESLKDCASYAHDCGVTMCVENMPLIPGLLFQDLEELDELVKEIEAQITLDVGHAHNNQISIQDMLRSSHIKHVHLSDNDSSFDQHDALGSADIDFKSIINGLKKINYNGILVVEVKSAIDVEPSLSYLKDLI
ncbi:MAG TPA: sugar phosphate isomerase/epimerase family protein [Methanobacteriaceae archaeon]|nr:sugar phosphate isomerase/epimerase family protein [Methanobacteriaceae archaeon]